MKVGFIVPQGWTGEYAGWAAEDAWNRTVELAKEAETLGFESLWAFDHFHTTPEPTDEITFESFATLTTLGALTSRVRLGHIVMCASYRNPALVAKAISSLDVMTGGRMELGVGGGWKREEWEAYGYDFPDTPQRLGRLRDSLAIFRAMMAGGHATCEGEYASVRGAINLPQPLQQPRVPIMVGGNGRKVTWRLAAEFADELNLDAMPADELPGAMEDIRRHCENVGRDPSTLRVSVHLWWEHVSKAASRRDFLAAYADAGVSRIMTLVREAVADEDALPAFVEDARAAGFEFAPPAPRGGRTAESGTTQRPSPMAASSGEG